MNFCMVGVQMYMVVPVTAASSPDKDLPTNNY